jgi:hypothetical protein
MTRRQYFGLVAGVFWASRQAPGAVKEEFVVIVHPSNRFDALSRSKASYLFLRKVSRWPWGAEVAPLDLGEGEPIRRVFVRQVLGLSEEQLAEYWIDERATRGISPPLQARDAAAAKLWVASKPGGIAYIPSFAIDTTVRAIRIDP